MGIPTGVLEDGAKMVTSTIGKSKTAIVGGAEKLFGKGKSVEAAADGAKTAEKDVAKSGLGSKVWKGTKATGKVAGKVGLGAAGLVGSAGLGAGKALLGSGSGMSSLLKYGSIAGVLALLANKNVMGNVTKLASGVTGALSQTADKAEKSTAMTAQATPKSTQTATTYGRNHDAYKQTAVNNINQVTQAQQPQAQKSATASHESEQEASL